MRRYRANQHSIVLSLESVSINKVLLPEFISESFTESKFDVNYVNTLKLTNLVGMCFQKQSNIWNKTFENKSIAKDY